MFKVLASKQIHSCFNSVSSYDIYLERSFELPFPPYPGLTVLIGEELEIEIKAVYYNLEEDRFDIYTEEDKELYNASIPGRWNPDVKLRTVEEIAREYVSLGWKIRT